MVTRQVDPKYMSDEFLDWETRDEAIPFWKHVIAGKSRPCQIFRIDRRHSRAL